MHVELAHYPLPLPPLIRPSAMIRKITIQIPQKKDGLDLKSLSFGCLLAKGRLLVGKSQYTALKGPVILSLLDSNRTLMQFPVSLADDGLIDIAIQESVGAAWFVHFKHLTCFRR